MNFPIELRNPLKSSEIALHNVGEFYIISLKGKSVSNNSIKNNWLQKWHGRCLDRKQTINYLFNHFKKEKEYEDAI